jgi:hypothetical protein
MRFSLVPSIIIAASLSIVTSKIVYFGFNSNYSLNIFTKQSFIKAFEHDVYKYRIFSKYLLLEIYNWLELHNPQIGGNRRIDAIARNGSQAFYYAYYYLNTFFLVLTSIIITLILHLDRVLKMTVSEKYMVLFLSIIIINLSQFVINPYDISSYFLQLLTLYIFLYYFDQAYTLTLITVAILISLSTINRESSALSVAIIILLLLQKLGFSRKFVFGSILVSASFLITYIALRFLIIDQTDTQSPSPMAGHILIDFNLIGLAFWLLFGGLAMAISLHKENLYMITFLHIVCIPYILICFTNGILWEIRLYIPLFLSAIILSKIDVTDFKIHLSKLNFRKIKTILLH